MNNYADKINNAREKRKESNKLTASIDTEYLDKVDEAIRSFSKSVKEIEIPSNEELVSKLDELKETVGSLKSTDGITADDLEAIVNSIKDIKIVVKKDEVKIPAPIVKIVQQDIFDIFKASDSLYNESSNVNYHGYIDREGRWFILREIDGEKTSYRFATSLENNLDYRDAIKNPQKLKYVYYDEIKL